MCQALGHEIYDLTNPPDQPSSWSFVVSRSLQWQEKAFPNVRVISMTAANVFKPNISGSSDGEWLSKGRIGSVNPVKGIKKWGYTHRF